MSSHPVDIHVGKRIRLRRNMLGMSQENLGNAIGVTFQQVQKYESGKNRVSSSRLHDFSRILEVPVAFFFEDFFSDKKSFALTENYNDNFEYEKKLSEKETIDLVRAFHNIKDPQLRKQLLNFAKTLAQQTTIPEKKKQ